MAPTPLSAVVTGVEAVAYAMQYITRLDRKCTLDVFNNLTFSQSAIINSLLPRIDIEIDKYLAQNFIAINF